MTVTGLDPTLERVLDLAGVAVFALSGALLGAQKRFDIIGIAVLALATGLAGGVVRDALHRQIAWKLADVPPVRTGEAAHDLTDVVLDATGSTAMRRWWS